MEINIDKNKEKELIEVLNLRTDAEANRIRNYLSMPDLSKTEGSPLHEIVKRVREVEALHGLDVINIPEIVTCDITFDLFDFPANTQYRFLVLLF